MLFQSLRQQSVVLSRRAIGGSTRTFTRSAPQQADVAKSGVDAAKSAAKTAQSQLSGVADKAMQLGGQGLKRAEGLLGSYSEPAVYNLKVAGSIAKQVYQAERLAPPSSIEQITSAYKTLWSRASDAGYWAKFVSSGEWKKAGIYAIEALGIFTIGEMIGRRSIVGYKLDTSGHPHGSH
ncbi:hypothetical protein K437DRAFT_248919 [Tilletiaria anomala UBC 951]|uniref:Uncharacterized protein n=1 Tax=Tilletiaria anomala (strain ATCC 24038 / CBS 436.72 / UBC 951) TaxID=1037660 RepID=A0A066VLJ4_TILAU|nr:uncharacterized protein K437DRAFT_248919 [Tilletiaria anomala UBC 951]KDN42622.1 hypothetical protein K437DRAFT_248919 [Tilletiaria anomala UBC 951]